MLLDHTVSDEIKQYSSNCKYIIAPKVLGKQVREMI